VSGLIGSPLAKYEYCTRSIECLPRALLRWVFHLPTVAWLVGLGFRLLGGGFLLSIAWRREDPLLGRLGLGLLIYYLYLHSWSQSWYFLSLLPLIPWAKPQHQPAMLIVCVSACAYYALVLIGNCFAADLPLAVTDLVEGLVVVVPPSISLWRRRATTALLAVAQPNTKEPADV
jgi:hypothetical protein